MGTSSTQGIIIGKNIKAARKIKGLSQRDLADKLGIAFQNLSVWENGKGLPSARYLIKLSSILAVSLDQLASPDGIASNLERALIPQKEVSSPIEDNERSQLMVKLEEIVSQALNQELAANQQIREIVRCCEEIAHLCKEKP